MSTRSQLRFVRASTNTTEPNTAQSTTDRIAQVYRHSDGYPSGVLEDLERLRNLLEATRTQRDPSYAAAQFIFLNQLSSMGRYLGETTGDSIHATEPQDVLETANMECLDQPLFLLGHGVEDPRAGIHGDEAYLYEVELPPRNRATGAGEWTVRVSERCGFPRWDGPTEEAFERVTWQYTGPLSGAREELVISAD